MSFFDCPFKINIFQCLNIIFAKIFFCIVIFFCVNIFCDDIFCENIFCKDIVKIFFLNGLWIFFKRYFAVHKLIPHVSNFLLIYRFHSF